MFGVPRNASPFTLRKPATALDELLQLCEGRKFILVCTTAVPGTWSCVRAAMHHQFPSPHSLPSRVALDTTSTIKLLVCPCRASYIRATDRDFSKYTLHVRDASAEYLLPFCFQSPTKDQSDILQYFGIKEVT